MPIAKTAQAIRDLEPGELIESLATDPGRCPTSTPGARRPGNELVEQTEDGGVYRFVIRKGR